MSLDALTPETLTETVATAVLEALAVRCRALHKREEVRGRLSMRGFCVCGHSSIGNGGALCTHLRELEAGGDEAAWLAKARALAAVLDAAEPATPGESTGGAAV